MLNLVLKLEKFYVSLGTSFCGLRPAPQKNLFPHGGQLLLTVFYCTQESKLSFLGQAYEGIQKGEVKMRKGKRSNSPFAFAFMGADAVCSSLLYNCRGEQPQSSANTHGVMAVCGLHHRSQDGPLEMLDSLHRATGREGL